MRVYEDALNAALRIIVSLLWTACELGTVEGCVVVTFVVSLNSVPDDLTLVSIKCVKLSKSLNLLFSVSRSFVTSYQNMRLYYRAWK